MLDRIPQTKFFLFWDYERITEFQNVICIIVANACEVFNNLSPGYKF